MQPISPVLTFLVCCNNLAVSWGAEILLRGLHVFPAYLSNLAGRGDACVVFHDIVGWWPGPSGRILSPAECILQSILTVNDACRCSCTGAYILVSNALTGSRDAILRPGMAGRGCQYLQPLKVYHPHGTLPMTTQIRTSASEAPETFLDILAGTTTTVLSARM
jgi:hypothetical protein